jgi:molecular chaperone DnaJ
MQLKVSNKGNDAGKQCSEIWSVAIEEQEHQFLKREGENLHYDLYISYPKRFLEYQKIYQP